MASASDPAVGDPRRSTNPPATLFLSTTDTAKAYDTLDEKTGRKRARVEDRILIWTLCAFSKAKLRLDPRLWQCSRGRQAVLPSRSAQPPCPRLDALGANARTRAESRTGSRSGGWRYIKATTEVGSSLGPPLGGRCPEGGRCFCHRVQRRRHAHASTLPAQTLVNVARRHR